MLLLSEDVIDDIIYCARIGDRQELEEIIDSVSKQRACRKSDVLSAAVESTTGNTALHHAAANGHLGRVGLYPLFLVSYEQQSQSSS